MTTRIAIPFKSRLHCKYCHGVQCNGGGGHVIVLAEAFTDILETDSRHTKGNIADKLID